MKIYMDYDGPILDIKRKSWEVHSRVIQELGGKITGDSDYYWSKKRSGVKRAAILENYGLNASFESEYLKKYILLVETKPYLTFDTIVEGAKEVLNDLASKHQLVLVTLRKNISETQQQLKNLHLTKYFTDIFIGGEKIEKSEANTKERMVNEEIKRTKKKGNLFLGDSSVEILAAKALGIPSVVVLNGIKNENYLRKYNPTYIIKDISQLPKLLKEI